MSSDISDKTLAGLASRGDSDAFRALLERHYDMMFRVALRFTGHREEAEDITQDICVGLPSKLKSYRGDAAFSSWLYQVVLNRVKDAYRKQETAQRMYRTYGEIEELRRGDEAQGKREQQWLAEMMSGLSEDLRETAILVVGEGLKQADAAKLLGVSEGTVSWRMSELKKALRELAKEEV